MGRDDRAIAIHRIRRGVAVVSIDETRSLDGRDCYAPTTPCYNPPMAHRRSRRRGMAYTSIALSRAGPVATLTLARPDLHNAFNAEMIGELRDCLTALAPDESVRVVVLTGAGQSFCAGADVNWMRASLDWNREQNTADADVLAAMFDVAWALPKPLIGRINGAALGGGVGLVACCDIAVAADTARFGFSEVKL